MNHVLKLGGGAGIDHASTLRNLALRVQSGERWVLVHGASAATNALAEQAGYPVKTLVSPGGHTSRYTDARMIEIYRQAVALVNRQIVAQLEACGVAALGLPGPGVVRARRKTAIRAIKNGRNVVIRDDYSGTITGIDSRELTVALDAGLMPVVAPVALGEEFEPLNVDGDLVAATIAQALQADTFMILSNVPGLLRDVSNPDSLIACFNLYEMGIYEHLAQGRMKKKLLAAQQAQAAHVILADARVESPIDFALEGGGTHIINEVRHADQHA
jgi:acetylglutamate/LysW-gamma-L-alpha-aminoadipate kinase